MVGSWHRLLRSPSRHHLMPHIAKNLRTLGVVILAGFVANPAGGLIGGSFATGMDAAEIQAMLRHINLDEMF